MTVFQKVGIVGLGLIGGSLLKHIDEHLPEIDVYGVDANPDTLKKANPYCRDTGSSPYDFPKNLDIVFICVPPSSFLETVQQLATHMSADTIFTDVLSVKGDWIETVEALRLTQYFIWGHPMAGKEVSGFDSSESGLFNHRPYLLIRPETDRLLHDISAFLELFNVKTVVLDSAEDHDRIVAAVSHVPYVMSCLTLPDQDSGLRESAGPGFLDTTRVSGSSPEWGVDVLLGNKEAVLKRLSTIAEDLSSLSTFIENEDRLELTKWLSKKQADRTWYLNSDTE